MDINTLKYGTMGLDTVDSVDDTMDDDNFNEDFADNSFQVIHEYTVDGCNDGIRIDKFLSNIQNEITRSYIQKLIAVGKILADGKPIKSNFKLKGGMTVMMMVPKPQEARIVAENIPLDIIYEDQDIILINKPKGMVVHPAAGHSTGTLVNALLYHCKGELSGINGILRPGIVHRIDRDTTGVLVACKNDNAHQCIAGQLKEHTITRRYRAIVYNTFKTYGGRVDAPIGRHPKDRKRMAVNHRNGKNAATNYQVLENINGKYAYIECTLETGRTHQIRVHMSSIHHPLIGDTVYGPDRDPFHLEGQALHAGVLGFIHPTTSKYMEFSAPLPDYFTELLDKLRCQ